MVALVLEKREGHGQLELSRRPAFLLSSGSKRHHDMDHGGTRQPQRFYHVRVNVGLSQMFALVDLPRNENHDVHRRGPSAGVIPTTNEILR